ncbi:hypothetical protein [Spirochaeta dissipatitropha]
MKIPPHCPNCTCDNHDPEQIQSTGPRKWFWLKGRRHSECAGDFQRFQCKSCGRYFSERTFSIDYRVHHIVPYRGIMEDHKNGRTFSETLRRRGISAAIRRNRVLRIQKIAGTLERT